MSEVAALKLARLQEILALRVAWREPLAQVKHMQHWLLEVEHILSGSLAQKEEVVSNATVGRQLDGCCEQLAALLSEGRLCCLEQQWLTQFLQQLSTLRPYLVQCYDRQDFPRTNNEMERSIRRLKTRYRRISGRKNWNSYLLRYGRCVAYYEWWEQDSSRYQQLVEQACRLDRTQWRQVRREASSAQKEQLRRFRFRHKRQTYLAALEECWATAAST